MKKTPKTDVDRRTFLSQSGAAVAATAATATVAHSAANPSQQPSAFAMPAAGSATVHATLATPWTNGPFALAANAHAFAQSINVLTDGRLHISLADGAHGQTADINPDDADIVLDSEQAYVSKHPAFAYFAGLPSRQTLGTNDLGAWLTAGGGQSMWDELAGEFDEKPLLVGHLGERPGLWSTTPLRSLADFKSTRISALGLGANVLRALGAEAVDVGSNSLADALATGSVTAVEFAGPYVSHMLNLHKHAHHVATSGIHLNGSTLSLRIKRAFWERLSPSHQAAITSAAETAYRTSVSENQAHTAIIKKAMLQTDGVKFMPFAADIRLALSKVGETVVAETAGTDAAARRIDTSYMGFRRAISEQIPMM